MSDNTNDIKVTAGSLNVFEDLGFENADEMLTKAELVRAINLIIQKRRLTQKRAAEILGVDQPKVSALRNGRLTLFSVEKLMKFLNALGRDVEIMIKTKPKTRPNARISVLLTYAQA